MGAGLEGQRRPLQNCLELPAPNVAPICPLRWRKPGVLLPADEAAVVPYPSVAVFDSLVSSKHLKPNHLFRKPLSLHWTPDQPPGEGNRSLLVGEAFLELGISFLKIPMWPSTQV